MEKIIVSLVVVAAIVFLIVRGIRSVKASGCCSGGCSCYDKNSRNKVP